MAETSEQPSKVPDYASPGTEDGGGGLTLGLPDDPGSKDRYLWAGVLLILTLVAYVPAIRGNYVWDDDRYITNNPALRDAEGLRRIWFVPGTTPQYYPLTHTTHWIEYQAWQLNPLGYHIVNVVLHAGSAAIIWLILRMLGVPGAWLAGAVFALHPIQVESVAWLTERKNVLCGVLFFGAIYAFLRYVGMRDPDAPADAPKTEGAPAEWQPWQWYVLSLVLFIGALLSKTIACSMPVCAILLLWWKRRLIAKYVMSLVPFFVIGIAMGIVTIYLERTHVGASGPEWDLSIAQRILIAGQALWFYVYKIFVPINLTFSYPRWDVSPSNVVLWLYPLGAIAVLVALWAGRARLGLAPLVAALWFVVTLVPALGFFNTYPMRYSFVADHFTYLSGVALMVLVVGWAASKMAAPGQTQAVGDAPAAPDSRRATSVLMSAIALLLLGGLTMNQSRAYSDEITLWRDVVKKNPKSWMAQHNLGVGLYKLAMVDRALERIDEAHTKLKEAEELILRSLELNPNNAEAYVNYGNLLLSRGKTEEALTQYAKAAELNSRLPDAWRGQGVVLFAQDKLEEAGAMFRKAIEVDPYSAQSYHGLANVLSKQGKRDEAIASFEKAIEYNPALIDARFLLAGLLFQSDRKGEAKKHYEDILRRNPYHAESWSNLAYLVAAEGDIRTAAKFFEASVQIDPRLERAQQGLKMARDVISGKYVATQPATTQSATTRSVEIEASSTSSTTKLLTTKPSE